MPQLARVRRRLKIHDLDILMTVLQAGGMGKAATRLNMSQSAVSKSIADLEGMLGVRLLDRNRRGVEPTPFGRALDQCGILVLDGLRQGLEQIEFLSNPTAGTLRIGTTPALGTGFMPQVISRVCARYPLITFHVTEADTTVLYRELSERNIDLVVTRMPSAEADKHLAATVLFFDPLVVVAGIDNPWSRRRKIKLADLVHESWTLSPSDSFMGGIAAEAFRQEALPIPKATVFASSIELRLSLVANGRFLTLVPAFLLDHKTRRQLFRKLPVELPTTRRPVEVLTLADRAISPVAQIFVDHASQLGRSLDQ